MHDVLRHRYVPAATLEDGSRVVLHAVEAGPEGGTPVILLHGFPECWHGWRHQLSALAAAGYRAIALDLRGYNHSSRPRGLAPYHLDSLVQDLPAVADSLGLGTFHLVGHDWGAALAWEVAALYPERVRTLTILNCPRAHVLQRMVLSSPAQLRRSWYILAFQAPLLGERLLRAIGPHRLFFGSSARGTFTEGDIAVYAAAWEQPGAVTAMLAYYRANLRRPPASRHRRITRPTLVLWGLDDAALGPELLPPTMAECDDGTLVELPGVSHWSPAEGAEAVNAHLLAHLEAHGGPDPLVYKLVPVDVWERAPDPWPGSADDLRDGFVHLSARAQLGGTFDRYFRDKGPVVALGVDPGRLLSGALRWEVSRKGQRFPHLYAPLPRAAVVRVAAVEGNAEGGLDLRPLAR